MVFKYDLSFSGDHFLPEKVLGKIKGDFEVDDHFKPTDPRRVGWPGEIGYGRISFWHPKKFSTEDTVARYEKDFVDFIELNYPLFADHDAPEVKIFMEIYSDGGQCNFEIFTNVLLQKLAAYKVSLPISVYVLKKRELQRWEKEIRQAWEG